MGIRFYCPKGHKLNVKAFLAGKRGICPHCDARFEIPQESQIPDNAPRIQAKRPVAGNGTALSAPAAQTAGTPLRPDAPDDGDDLDEVLDEVSAYSIPSPDRAAGDADHVATAAPSPLAATATDPFAEAPAALWYVRPPGGGQYGPARSDVMQRWIDEGRVCTESLVWREGWTDWQPAGPIFPSLGSVGASESQDTRQVPPARPDAGSLSPPPNATTDVVRLRHQSAGKRKSIAAVVFLALLIVVLGVMLVLVLQ